MVRITIAQKMKNYISDHHLKQSSIARSMGVNITTFNMMLNGKKKVYAEEMIDFCNTIGIKLDELVAYDPNLNSDKNNKAT